MAEYDRESLPPSEGEIADGVEASTTGSTVAANLDAAVSSRASPADLIDQLSLMGAGQTHKWLWYHGKPTAHIAEYTSNTGSVSAKGADGTEILVPAAGDVAAIEGPMTGSPGRYSDHGLVMRKITYEGKGGHLGFTDITEAKDTTWGVYLDLYNDRLVYNDPAAGDTVAYTPANTDQRGRVSTFTVIIDTESKILSGSNQVWAKDGTEAAATADSMLDGWNNSVRGFVTCDGDQSTTDTMQIKEIVETRIPYGDVL